jgi:hypothetical protein
MCKNLLPIIDHVQWENHVLSNGMMSVTIVEPEYADKWAGVHKEMEAVSQKLMAGEQMPMCNFCKSMGGIMMTGAANWQNVESNIAGAEIMLVTSDKPEVAEMIKNHAKRTIEEFDKMMAAEGEMH